MKMSQSTQEFMGMAKMDIEEISALRRLYEHEKHMLHASQQKLFQYQQGKVRPQKLGEVCLYHHSKPKIEVFFTCRWKMK